MPVWPFPLPPADASSSSSVAVEVTTGALDHVAEALDRLPSQFRDKRSWIDTVTALVTPMQRFENAAIDMLLLRGIDTGFGAQLDRIGRIVREARAGETDDEVYRRRLRARISQKRSRGSVENLIRVATLIVYDDDAVIVVERQNIATVVVRVEDVAVSATLAALLISFLRGTVKGGVRVLLETSADVESEMLHCAIASFATAPLSIGATTIPVTSTDGFPNSGSLDIDLGVAGSEQRTYSGKTATSFTGVQALTTSHAQGCAVQLAGSPGKGLGDSSNAATGGQLASANQ